MRYDYTHGQVFGRWTVICRVENNADKGAQWMCRCECGTERIVLGRTLHRGTSQSCGCRWRDLALARTGTKSPGWKGGRCKTSSGYVLVHAPEHPTAQVAGYVPEHRLVMEKTLGRYLGPEETVHHINGVRTDNRPENLELWSSRQPKGQRVSDLLEWASEIHALYGGTK